MIKIDIKKAREIWREKISESRKIAFEINDIAIRDAQLSKNKSQLAAAISRRDELRDLGKRIDAATSIDELKSILP